MYQIINEYAFIRAFERAGRNEQFSREALVLLFDYFESLDNGEGPGLELDVIAICCEYSEDDVDTIIEQYNVDVSECADDDERIDTVVDYLNENTSYIGRTDDDKLVYAQF